MEDLQNWFLAIDWLQSFKNGGMWLLVFSLYASLIQVSAMFIGSLIALSQGESNRFTTIVSVFSFAWALFIMVN